MRVLITGAHGGNAELRTALEARGATILEMPVIAIVPADVAPLEAALRRLDSYNWIAFTSRHAVAAVFDCLANLEIDFPAGIQVAAVAGSTGHELELRSIRVTTAPEGTAAALAKEMARRGVAGSRVLLPIGDLALPDLRQGLERAGAEVTAVVAYRTVPAEPDPAALQALRAAEVDAVTLASPSAIRNLAAVLDEDRSSLARVRLVCIGPTTAAAVTELGYVPAAVAEEHSAEGLARTVAGLFSTEPPHDRI